MWAAATAPSPKCSPRAAHRPRSAASILRPMLEFRAHPPGPARRGPAPGRCHGPALRRQQLRPGRHAAGAVLRAGADPGALPRWRAWSDPAASSAPIPGTWTAAAFPMPSCARNLSRWAFARRARPAKKPHARMYRGGCGNRPGWLTWRPARFTVQRTYASFDEYWAHPAAPSPAWAASSRTLPASESAALPAAPAAAISGRMQPGRDSSHTARTANAFSIPQARVPAR